MSQTGYKRKLLPTVGLAILLIISPAYSSAGLAADSEQGNNKANETDIEDNTMVNGEDISDLSDEELQYVPKAWRDGSGGDSHPNAEENNTQTRSRSTFSIMSRSSYPDVNDYISRHDLPEMDTAKNHKGELPVFPYRNGYSKPEGVVAHETANNSSTIDSEIAFMMSNYNRAFVHAFVDDQNVREVHSTNKAAWGAGRYANERFIHVELVRTHSFDAFARSINNYTNYIAGLLDKYDLGVSTASSDGSGSLWAHNDVTKYLGGTTHTDPISYFNKWGYSWDEFVELVQEKYDDMNGQVKPIAYSGQNKAGGLKSNSTVIHPNLTGYFDRTVKAGEKYTDKLFYVSQKARRNGKTYFLISDKPSRKKGTIGWVLKKDITLYNQPSFKGKPKTFKLKNSANVFTKPWSAENDDDELEYLINNSDDYAGSYVDITGTRNIGGHTWHQGKMGKQKIWIRDRAAADKSLTHFPDVSASSEHYHNIYALTNRNVIQGVPHGNGTYRFQPWESITRQQTANIFTSELDLPAPDDLGDVLHAFEDVDSSHYYAEDIAAASAEGIFEGKQGEFMGGNSLTREQMASIIVKAYDLKDNGTDPHINMNKVSDEHQNNVKILAQHGITDAKNEFRPWEDVTRQQFVSFVNRAMK